MPRAIRDPDIRLEPGLDLREVSARIEQRLAAGAWEEQRLAAQRPDRLTFAPLRSEPLAAGPDAAVEVASFALGLSGQRTAARREGRLSRLIAHFALAATLALTGVAASACGAADGDVSGPAVDVSSLPGVPGAAGAITTPAASQPARYDQLVLLDPGGSGRWALLVPLDQATTGAAAQAPPVLVDKEGAGLDQVGGVYAVRAQPVPLGTRDGASQFLDPLADSVASTSSFSGDANALKGQLLQQWQGDQRFAAATRAIEGQPSLLDAAYNARAASLAGGVHTYAGGVVLRVDPQNPVLQVTDRALLESGKPLRAEDVVFVAIRESERALYDPGQVVTLRNVAVDRQETTVSGQQQTIFVMNAALDGARVEPDGTVDLQALLNQRLQRTDADLAIQAQELSSDPSIAATLGASPLPTPQSGATAPVNTGYQGPAFLDDYLMFLWLTNSGWYHGSRVTINNPPGSLGRPGAGYYYTPPSAGGAGAAADGASGAGTRSRSQALQSARNAISGQAAGTGGGTAATAKAAADTTARVSAATSKAASVAGQVSSASAGKSIASVPAGSSSTAARSAGSTASSSRSSGSGSSIGRGGGTSGFGGSGTGGSSS